MVDGVENLAVSKLKWIGAESNGTNTETIQLLLSVKTI